MIFWKMERNTAEDVACRLEKFLNSIKENAEENRISIFLISPVPVKQGAWGGKRTALLGDAQTVGFLQSNFKKTWN